MFNVRYKIGLDIGITSVGWATVLLDYNDEPYKILHMGTRIFDAAEHPKTGASLALPRREARSARRRLRRRRHRLERIRNLIVTQGILSEEEMNNLYDQIFDKDIYEIRVEALDKLLTPEEWTRLLIHLAQRRGFKSNRKADAKENEAGRLLQAVKENRELLEAKGYRTIGEMLLYDEKFKEHKRNKNEDYSHTIAREMLVAEINLLFESQRVLQNEFASEEFQQKYLEIYTSQRSFDQGPGGPSPYAGNQIEKMIGQCTFERDEKRAPRAAYSFEYFTLLQNINNMRIQGKESIRTLTEEERQIVIGLAHDVAELNYFRIRTALKLNEEELFVALQYGSKTNKEVESKAKFTYLKGYHQIRKALDKVAKGRIKTYPTQTLNAIAYAYTVYKSDDNKIKDYLKVYDLDSEDMEILLSEIPGFSKFGRLSVQACDKIIPYLEQGKKYNEACDLAGYDFKARGRAEKSRLLPSQIDELEDITNPVVRRAIAQTRKVINSIIRVYDASPAYISVELAREMAKDLDERNKIRKGNEENATENARVVKEITNLGIISPKGQDIVKYKLWKQQDGICPYSLRPLELSQLFKVGYADVDHIIPYSKCFNDSYRNKVVTSSEENRQKGNRLPLEYLKGERRDAFVIWVKNNIHDRRKQSNLLKERLTEEDIKEFKDRNLNDTKYISRFMLNYINDYLQFGEIKPGRSKHVTAVNGVVTSYIRKRWGLSKVREDGDLHHAVDALVVACTTDGMIQKVTRYSTYQETRFSKEKELMVDTETGEVIERFPLPWPEFRKELEMRLANDPTVYSKYFSNYSKDEEVAPLFVSRMPKRKVTGAAHKETIKSPKAKEDGFTIVKRSLTALKLNKDGEIADYYNPESDTRLYEALKARLAMHGGKGEKAFTEPFYKPTSTGKQGPLVKKVKLIEKASLTVDVHSGKGIADNDRMVRIDVFKVEGDGYYFIPIYVADTLKRFLPKKASVQNKPYEDWREMKEDNFLFSLYPNDLVKVTAKKDIKFSIINKDSTLPRESYANECLVYFVGANISTAAIGVINHDNTYCVGSLGIKTLKKIEKYQVDVLGNYSKVTKEKRMRFR